MHKRKTRGGYFMKITQVVVSYIKYAQMNYKALPFIALVIFIILSCQKPKVSIDNHVNLDTVFKGFSIRLIRDSTHFGKLDDWIEIKDIAKGAQFKVGKADSVVIIDTTYKELALKIYSKPHNSKSLYETILVLQPDENSFYSLSTYRQFKPIGYPKNTGASLLKENDRILVSFFNNSERSFYTIDIGDKRGLATRSFAKEIEDKYEIANFLKETNGEIFNEEKNDIDILVN